MNKKTRFNSRNVDNDDTMNDFLVSHHGITTVCLPESIKVHSGQIVHLENPYKNTKDAFRILSKSRNLHGIVEYRAKSL